MANIKQSSFIKSQLVNKQFNSPIKLYSPENVADTLNKQAQILANGAVGIDFKQLAAPNLANSAVLRMLQEEEERQRGGGARGLKRVTWPPPPEEQDLIYNEQPVFSKGLIGPNITGKPDQQPTWQPAPQVQGYQQPALQQEQPPVVQQVYQPIHFEPPPTTVILRPEPPISQEPSPIFSSQPAATKVEGAKMRGDEKWPPATVKAQTAAENEARVALARGPAFRPRKVKKDYTAFFAQNALNPSYPGYKAPPGTQHYIEEGTSNL